MSTLAELDAYRELRALIERAHGPLKRTDRPRLPGGGGDGIDSDFSYDPDEAYAPLVDLFRGWLRSGRDPRFRHEPEHYRRTVRDHQRADTSTPNDMSYRFRWLAGGLPWVGLAGDERIPTLLELFDKGAVAAPRDLTVWRGMRADRDGGRLVRSALERGGAVAMPFMPSSTSFWSARFFGPVIAEIDVPAGTAVVPVASSEREVLLPPAYYRVDWERAYEVRSVHQPLLVLPMRLVRQARMRPIRGPRFEADWAHNVTIPHQSRYGLRPSVQAPTRWAALPRREIVWALPEDMADDVGAVPEGVELGPKRKRFRQEGRGMVAAGPGGCTVS